MVVLYEEATAAQTRIVPQAIEDGEGESLSFAAPAASSMVGMLKGLQKNLLDMRVVK